MQRYTGDVFFLQLSLNSLLLSSAYSILLLFRLFIFIFRHFSGVVSRVSNLYAPVTQLLDNYLLDGAFPGLCPKTVD